METIIPEETGHRSRHDHVSYDIQEGLAIPSESRADARAGGHTDRAVVPCPLRGTLYLLHRMRSAPQVPVHCVAERGEATIATWRGCDLGQASRLRLSRQSRAGSMLPSCLRHVMLDAGVASLGL